MAHHLEGHMDLSAIERSRLLGSLGPLCSVALSTADSSLGQLSVSGSDLTRSVSPSALQQYASRFLPTVALHPTGTSYSMMASYLANSSHVPEALKHMLPEMQQYWSTAAHSDSYARYLLGNMYYPYLPYLPATESLALFAQNSANVAQMEAALQAQAVQHRIYDLQKEALLSQGAYPHGLYSRSHLYSPPGQIEATNLSLPSSSREKTTDRPKDVDPGRVDVKKELDRSRSRDNLESESETRRSDTNSDKNKMADGSERTRGRSSKTDDKDKIKCSTKLPKTGTDTESKKLNEASVPENLSKRKTIDKKPLHSPGEIIILDSPKSYSKETVQVQNKTNSNKYEDKCFLENSQELSKVSPNKLPLHSPSRQKRVTSPESGVKRASTPEKRRRVVSPVEEKHRPVVVEQEMPENLCIKDREITKVSDKVHEAGLVRVQSTDLVKTQSLTTTTTVTVTSVLEITSTDNTGMEMSPSANSAMSRQSTVTTYSLPYYHNLYARSQSQEGKRVHATTYIPEVGTVSSPVAGAPSVISVHVDTKTKLRDKIQADASPQHLIEPKPHNSTLSPRSESFKPKVRDDLTRPLFVETGENRLMLDGRVSEDSTVCNNRGCVHSDPKVMKHCSPKCSADSNCSSQEGSIDLSIKKTRHKSRDESTKTKENTKQPVIRKYQSLHSPTLEYDKDSAQDLRKHNNKTKEENSVKKVAEKRKSSDLIYNSREQPHAHASKKMKACVSEETDVITLTDDEANDKPPLRKDSNSNKTQNRNAKHQNVKEEKNTENNTSCKDECTDKVTNSAGDSDGSTKSITGVKPLLNKTEGADGTSGDIVKNKGVLSKQNNGNGQPSGIPVGIAVARQRSIAPKFTAENDTKKTSEEAKKQHPVADVKPIRPLKVIRPSTKGCGTTVSEKRNDLPANLIVTGGATPPSVYWPEDPTSRQLAAQFLQTGHPLTPTSWYGNGGFQFNQGPVTSTSGLVAGSQLPFTVPAGYKLAQDTVTGQILLLPNGSDVFDNTRLFSGLQMGSQISSAGFGTTVLTPDSVPVSLATSTLFAAQPSVTDRPASLDLGIPTYASMFNSSMVQSAEVTIKEEKSVPSTRTSTAAVITPSIILSSGHDSTTGSSNHVLGDNPSEKSKLINLSQTTPDSDVSLIPGQQCTYAFPVPTAPVVFGSSLLTTQNTPEPVPEVNQLKHDYTSVQSRGTSPMLPASDSCAEDTEENKSDDNVDEIVDVCIVENKKDELERNVPTERNEADAGNVLTNLKQLVKHEYSNVSLNSEVSREDDEHPSEKEKDCSSVSKPFSQSGTDISESNTAKSPKSGRNIFTDLTEYNPFMDPQVLQAADGLELLSALAEKSAMCIKEPAPKQSENELDQTLKAEIKPEIKPKLIDEESSFEKSKQKKDDTEVRLKTKIKIDDDQKLHKPRVKCGKAFKPKKEKKAQTPTPNPGPKMTTFLGISVPEDDDVIDSMELEMKMRLAELQRRYREKQKQLAKLTPRRSKEVETKLKERHSSESTRGPGRPKKKSGEISFKVENASDKSPKSKSSENGSKSSSPSSSVSGSSGHHGYTTSGSLVHASSSQHSHTVSGQHSHTTSGQHGHSGSSQHGPTKKKKLAEMLVDRVFRKTGGSFKIPLSKKVSLIAPARIEFPGSPSGSGSDRNEHVRHNKSLDFGKLIKRSRLSQINGKDGGFVGGFWHRKYGHEKKHSLHSENKIKKRKLEQGYPSKSGLNLLAEYATKSSSDVQKKKKKTDERDGTTAVSPDSPNKKRKPGRPKKCDVIRPGVTETIVAKQSKHMDFFRWQNDEPKPERKITLEGKTPLKPLYLDEWNVRRSERIFLSDPSPQTSPNAVSPGAKAPQGVKSSPGVKASPGIKPKSDSERNEKDKKPKQEKSKKSQSQNMSLKVKKKYSTGFNQQKSREKTTELLKATRDRLTQKRQEKKMLMRTSTTGHPDDSDTDDMPLSLFKPKTNIYIDPPRCTLTTEDLCDGIRILVFMDGLFHEGELKAIRPPDIYGAVLDNERKTRPHYYSQEEILKEAIKDTKPVSGDQLREGTRICAYWSQQFSCLYPGTIARGSPGPVTDRSLYNVEFDDGDTGKIPLDHIRIIPQDFPHVEYDPNPLLLLTKRRRTMSISESVSSEPRKSVSESNRDAKVKRGPGRPPKTDRLLSIESVGDEDVFVNESQKLDSDKPGTEDPSTGKDGKVQGQQVALFRPRDLWAWSGSSTKRPGMKGKARKEYYKTVVRGRETISQSSSSTGGESAVFLSTGRPNLPYVGRIESFWEGWGGQMVVKVKWFYHPEETKGGKRLQNMKGALFRSDHEDENDVQTISHKCEVLPYPEFRRRIDVISHEDTDDVYYLAGSYEPTVGHIKFEPGVI